MVQLRQSPVEHLQLLKRHVVDCVKTAFGILREHILKFINLIEELLVEHILNLRFAFLCGFPVFLDCTAEIGKLLTKALALHRELHVALFGVRCPEVKCVKKLCRRPYQNRRDVLLVCRIRKTLHQVFRLTLDALLPVLNLLADTNVLVLLTEIPDCSSVSFLKSLFRLLISQLVRPFDICHPLRPLVHKNIRQDSLCPHFREFFGCLEDLSV